MPAIRLDTVDDDRPTANDDTPQPTAPREFGHDPTQLVAHLALCVAEIIAGARAPEQLGRWVNESVYSHVMRRMVLASRARTLKGQPITRPRLQLSEPRLTRVNDDVIEGVVIVHQRSRSRAVAIRLERHRERWRATSLSVL